MEAVQHGNTVKVHYTGKLSDGEVFDSSVNREPLEFKIGAGQLIPGFENGVMGMKTGESKTITLEPAQAYGDRHDNLVVEFAKADFPENIVPSVGLALQLSNPDGNTLNAVITEVGEDSVTIDANHPLAGKTLVFEIELLEIKT